MTYNNMACFYRKRGNLRTALTYLEQSLDIESRMEENFEIDVRTSRSKYTAKKAETHLNTCAVLS